MKVIYREEADGDGRHYIHGAVEDRHALLHESSVNAPTLELEIDETPANAELCRHLLRKRSQCDARGLPKHAVDATGQVVEVDGWEAWIDPEDGSAPPALGPATYSPVTVEVDAGKARLRELSDKGTLSTAERDEAIDIVIERQARGVDAREVL